MAILVTSFEKGYSNIRKDTEKNHREMRESK